MLSKPARFSGLTAAVAVLATLFAAGPASAAVTSSHVTTPGSTTFTYYDSDSSDPQTFTVAGTSNGTTPDTVDIRCYYDDGNYSTLRSSVAVAADGSFTTDANKTSETTCILRAVPTSGYSNGLANYTGPVVGFGYADTYTSGDRPYGFDIESSTLKANNYFYSASNCGFDYQYLYGADFEYYTGVWDCNAALYNNGGYDGRSEIQVGGHNAYTPEGAQNINGSAAGLPTMGLTRSFNAATGEWTITETDPLVYCANADDTINDVVDAYPTCDHFVAAPAKLVRTIVESNNGLLVTITDRWSSTDGQTHPLRALYDNYQNDDTSKFPGESTYTAHGDGTVIDLGNSAVGTAYFQYDDYYAPGPQNTQGALTWTTAPARAVFTSAYDFQLQYDRTIPASGTLDITHYYSSGFTREAVQSLAAGVEDANAAPSVAITSPASGSTTSSDAVTVIGTASDNVGVTSLTVNGIPTAVLADGSWSQRVPLNPGANTITAIAKDASGQASQAQVSVTYSPPAAPSCTVPKVTGLSQAAAATAIGNAGCTVGVTTQVPSKVAKGNVATQSRAAGSKLPAYFPIDLKISSGPVGKAKLVTKSVTVKNGRITVQISCPKTSGNACNGTAKIRTRTKLGGARRTLGTKAFQAPAGKKRKTTFVLSKTNARRIKGHTVKTQVFIVYRDEDGKSRTTKANLTIKG